MVDMQSGHEVLLESIEDGVCVITLNRPDCLNALDVELMRRLAESVARAADNDDVRCIVLTGAGRGFCSGGDIRGINRAAQHRREATALRKTSTERRARWLRRGVEAARLLFEMPKVSIAMINGACAGAGLSLAAACDFRFAAESAKFVPAFVANGVPGDYGGSWLWTRLLGASKARQLYLMDQARSAQEALSFGLVDRLYQDGELFKQTLEAARQFALLTPSAVAYAKANLNAALTDTLAQSLDRESLNMMLGRNALIESQTVET
jgi:2-(1,2-epoxy-1,2-dihydrophenyl)acetyl-CoA isomerase